MPTYNYKARELIAKIVYYGPGRCGKTTNLQQIHARMRPETRSELLSVATETDRTIYFDLLPLNLGTISGMKFMVRLFTVPGQVYYSETRKLVLRGADGVVFVADSQDHMVNENRESLQDLKTNLLANGLDYNTLPLVLQYNKRDLPRLIPEAELDATLNDRLLKAIPAVASEGQGVLETLRYVTVSVFNHVKSGGRISTPMRTQKPEPAQPAEPAPATISTQGLPPMQGGAPPAAARGPTGDLRMPPPPPPPDPPAAVAPATAPSLVEAARAAAQAAAKAAASPPKPPPVPPAVEAIERAASDGRALGQDFIIEEFKLLALITSQLQERVARLEQEAKRLGRENQELRELLSRSVEGA